MFFAIALTLLSSTFPPSPVVFGFHAVQCERLRKVVCVDDPDWATGACLADTMSAIAIINKAIGRDVFEHAGIVSMQGARVMHAQGVMIVMTSGLPEHILGITAPHAREKYHTLCIDRVGVIISPIVVHSTENQFRIAIIVHEFMHAIGAEHADPSGGFMSRMEPVYTTRDWMLTPADVYTLRVVYGP